VLSQLGVEKPRDWRTFKSGDFQLADCWILSRLHTCVRETTEHLERFRLNDSTGTPYHFLWDDFADWYLEAIKPRLYGDEPGGDVARAVAAHCLSTVLRLLHPVMPYITETLFQRLPGNRSRTIVTASWPRVKGKPDAAALEAFRFVQAVVNGTRAIRADYNVAPNAEVRIILNRLSARQHQAVAAEDGTIRRLARATFSEAAAGGHSAVAHAVLPGGAELLVDLGGAIDVQKECARIRDERDRLEKQLAGLKAKLGNPGFLAKAPPAIVEGERVKEREWTSRSAALREKLKALGC
jgi:valyl-tRNA synthetase